MKDFKNKVAAITGAGSGMGRSLAVLLAARGCHVALSDINEKGLAETVKLLDGTGVKVTSQRLDVADKDAVLITVTKEGVTFRAGLYFTAGGDGCAIADGFTVDRHVAMDVGGNEECGGICSMNGGRAHEHDKAADEREANEF